MARQILPLAGQIVGGMIGGPVGAAIGGAIGSVVGNAIDPQIIKGPKLGDGQVQTSAEGVYRPIVLGTGAVMGNIIHRGPEVVRTHRESQGKGSGPKVESERRYRTFAIRVAEGPIAGILRIWMDEKLVYDIRPESTIPAESAEFASRFRLYLGDENQLPDPDIEAYLGIGNVNAYRGTAYVVFPNFDLTDYGDRIPQFRFEVSTAVPTQIDIEYDGGQSFPSEIVIPVSPSPQLIGYEFNAIRQPDKLTIETSGGVFIDTGYIGQTSYQSELDAALGARGLPPETISPGDVVINNEHYALGDGYKSDHSTGITVKVWAPIGGTLWHLSLFVTAGDAGGSIPLSDVVTWLHRRVGAILFDVSDLEGTDVDGIVFSGDYTAADCIRTLMPVYMFDASEHDAGSGYRINYVKRGGQVVATITADDLVDEPEESVREDALERPKKLHLHFQSPTVGYAPAKATSMRNSPDVLVTGEVSASVPVVFSDVDEAWRRAGVMHQVAWSEVAGTQELVLSDAWLELVPTDNIGLVLRDQQRRLRITKIEHVEGTLKCDLMTDRQSSYTSNLTGIPLPEPTPPPPSIVGPTDFAVMDIPALTENDDRLLYYVAASGMTEAWNGAVVHRKRGNEWVTVANFNKANRTTMGVLKSEVRSGSPHYTDTTNEVLVELHMASDELHSFTDQDYLSEGAAFALQSESGWEIFQYRDAEYVSDGTYRLTHLARGRLNTRADAHAVGAKFVLLDRVQAVDVTSSLLYEEMTHRAVSVGNTSEGVPTITTTFMGMSQSEWKPAHILITVHGDDDGWVTQVVPRHRFGTEENPIPSINLSSYGWRAVSAEINVGANRVGSDQWSFGTNSTARPITVTVEPRNRFTWQTAPSLSKDIE